MTRGREEPDLPERFRRVAPLALLLLLVVVYLPALQAGFIWDDDFYVTGNQNLRSLEGLGRIWLEPVSSTQYYPFVLSSFWVEQHLWDNHPFGYHLVNVLLHALSAWLVWRILRRLAVPGAGLAAAIFALHPVQVESVAWVTERKNTLSTVLYLAALLSYLRYRPLRPARSVDSVGPANPADPGSTASRRRFYWLALALFALALLSKTVTASLPAAILLLIWWKAGRIRLRDVVPLVPFAGLGLFLGLKTAWIEAHLLGAEGSEWGLTLVERVLLAGRAVWFYALKILWPHPLAFFYTRWNPDQAVWWQYLYPAAVLLVLAVLWIGRRRIGRGPLVAALFFCGTLFPALGFVNVYPFRYSYVADHFQYLASLGLITLLAAVLAQAFAPAGLARLVRRSDHAGPATGFGRAEQDAGAGRKGGPARGVGRTLPGGAPSERGSLSNLGYLPGRWKLIRGVAAGILLAALAALTFRQSRIYDNAETLWRDTIRKTPTCWAAYVNLSTILSESGRAEEAIPLLERAVAANPSHTKTLNNLGIAYSRVGRIEDAASCYRRALAADPENVNALANLAQILSSQGRFEDAAALFERAVRLWPGSGFLHLGLGSALAETGRPGEAEAPLRRAVALEPGSAEARFQLARVLEALGRREEAAQAYREALRLDPAHRGAREALARLLGASPTPERRAR
jgi:tetratricopeptide (TPR) repeat protein